MKRVLISALLCLAACEASEEAPPKPVFWPLETLVARAKAHLPAVADAQGNTITPMSAIVTPAGEELPLQSPPFAAAPTLNTLAGPRLNVGPGLSEGRFTPYVTLEMWLNDFGDVWVQPLFVLVKGDAEGHIVRDAGGRVQPVGGAVFGADVHHRFYSPFWRFYWVAVPEAKVEAVAKGTQPKSVKEVLDSGWELEDGPLGLCPIVPDDLELDPALKPAADGGARTPLAGAWGAAAEAEYTASGRTKMLTPSFSKQGGWFEGTRVSYLGFGSGMYVELPGKVVEGAPIFVWVDRDGESGLNPLGLPNVGGHGPLFSGKPLTVAGGRMDHSALWDAILVVRPAGAQPFIPATEAFRAYKAVMRRRLFPEADADAPTPLDTSPEVDALPNVNRWAGRMALHPACFAAKPEPTPESAAAWAASCGFLDSQDAIERSIDHDRFIDPKMRILCPIVLWSNEVNP